jgi:hypothetical protein
MRPALQGQHGVPPKHHELEAVHALLHSPGASSLKLSDETVRNIFQDKSGVIKITKGKRLRGKREYVTLRVSETVLADDLTRAPFNKQSVVLLGGDHVRVSRQ